MHVEKKASDLIYCFTMDDLSRIKECDAFFNSRDNPINYQESRIESIKSIIINSFYESEGSYSDIKDDDIINLISHKEAMDLLETKAKDGQDAHRLREEYIQEHLNYSINLIK